MGFNVNFNAIEITINKKTALLQSGSYKNLNEILLSEHFFYPVEKALLAFPRLRFEVWTFV